MTREASIRRRVADVNGVVGQCRDCGRDMGSNRNKFGLLVHAGHGQCTSCRSSADRAKKKAGVLPAPRVRVVVADESWRDGALCQEVGGDLWHPEKGESTREAKRICFACEVRVECLQFAKDNRAISRFGIWGGLSERERRRKFAGEDEERQDEAAA